jgi:hypothetical protein
LDGLEFGPFEPPPITGEVAVQGAKPLRVVGNLRVIDQPAMRLRFGHIHRGGYVDPGRADPSEEVAGVGIANDLGAFALDPGRTRHGFAFAHPRVDICK